jgi:hypothetical protein
MRAPDSFVKDLKAYDPKLRCRWGTHCERWIIERKVEIRNPAWRAERPINPFGQNKRAKDLWAGWREGYLCVLMVDRTLLNWQTVAPELARTDRERAGSWEAVNRAIEAADAVMEQQRERSVANWHESASLDAADALQWREGNYIATPMTPSDVRPMDTLELREGYTVRVRKGQHGTAENPA